MGKKIGNMPCPNCRANGKDKTGDNKVIFAGDGGAFCYACKKHFKPDSKDIFKVQETPKKLLKFIYGECVAIPDRFITKKTCEFFDYQILKVNGTEKHIANYFEARKIVKQKIRISEEQGKPCKKFYNTGDTTNFSLFGMNKWKPNENMIVSLIEGELDTMSVAQANGLSFPVVGLPDGTGSIKLAIQHNMDWLCGWKGVALGLDNDETGQEATQIGIELLCKTQVYVINYPKDINDPNEFLKHGYKGVTALNNCVRNAAPAMPESIIDLGSIIEEALEPVQNGFSFGFNDLDDYCYGMRPHELILLGAGSSVGKTTFLNQLAITLAYQHHQKVGLISFEQTNREIVQKLVGNLMGKRIWVPRTEFNRDQALLHGKSLSQRVYSIDPSKGLNTVEKIINKIIYCVTVQGMSWIFLDHLTYIAALIPGDERRGLDVVMAELARIVKEYECSIVAVSHLAKPTLFGKPGSNSALTFEQGRVVLGTDFRGSQALQYYATTILAMYRNIKDINSITTIEILKNRIDSDYVGKLIELLFSKETGRLSQYDRVQPYRPLVNAPTIEHNRFEYK